MKIAPGLRVNLTPKGVSARVGPKGVGYTVNSKGEHTASASIPGSGLSYSKRMKPSGRRSKATEDSAGIGQFNEEYRGRKSSFGKRLVAVLLVLICIILLISVFG